MSHRNPRFPFIRHFVAGLAVLCAVTCLPPHTALAEESASGYTSALYLMEGERSQIHDISFDGTTVVGDFSNADTWREAFVWSFDTGFLPLGSWGGTDIRSNAYAVSADGSVVVGRALTAERVSGRGRNRTVIPSRWEAFRWTAEDGMVSLGSLGGWSVAHQVSADGNVIAGASVNADGMEEIFRWTAESGMVGLGVVTGSPWLPGRVSGMSADGRTITGQLWLHEYDRRAAFVWGLDDDKTDIISYDAVASRELEGPTLPYLSWDGSVAAGHAWRFSQEYIDVAMIWTKEGESPASNNKTGLQSIGLLEDGDWNRSRVMGITADGLLAVGYISDDATRTSEAFTWDWINGMTFLPKPSDEFSAFAGGVSLDGSVIMGTVYPSGSENVWSAPAIWVFDPETMQKEYKLHFLHDILRDGGVDWLDELLELGDLSVANISGDGNAVAGRVQVQGGDDIPFVAVLDEGQLGNPGDDGDGDDGDDGNGNDGEPGELVASVSLVDVGPRGRHLDVIASVVDADGAAVSGALVEVAVEYLLTGQVSFESGTTGSDGTVSWRYSNANADDYKAEVITP